MTLPEVTGSREIAGPAPIDPHVKTADDYALSLRTA